MFYKVSLVLAGLLVSACSIESKSSFESPEVVVTTDAGPVTCQLYTRDELIWDRATLRPSTLTDDQANQICRDEGVRLQGPRG